eukprot:Opistho-1_new@3447
MSTVALLKTEFVFLLEIIEEVKTVWSETLPLFVRISATEWAEGGWNEDDSIKLAHILKSIGVDLIDSSTGGNIHTAKIPIAPSYQVSFAQKKKKKKKKKKVLCVD